MRFLLDTNVLSEPARPRASELVLDWLRSQPSLDLAISVLTLGEIRKGIARFPSGERRQRLEGWIMNDLARQFRGRVLEIDAETAGRWGELSAAAEVEGRPLPVIDGLLLATASVHGLTFVTRNEKDCAGRGVPTLDPWRA